VNLTSQQQTVEVTAGTQAVALAGKPPSSAEPIPASLLLKVADAAPAQDHEDKLCAEVDGTAPAGSDVLVDGAPAAIAEDGHFRVRVPAAPGKNNVLVAIRDAGGRETTRAIPCGTSGSIPHIKDFAIRWRKKGQ
jgi:hypothetical protein